MSSELTTTVDILTPEMFKSALPEKMQKSVNQELIDQVNAVLSNPDEYEAYRDNLISYTSVMSDGKFKLTDYVQAVRFVSFRLMGHDNNTAYKKAFPVKYQKWVSDGVASKDIASYITAYHKGKLVNLIYAQTLIPTHVINQDIYQKAINTQYELMIDTKVSPKVRSDAANSLMTQLKPPEIKQVELNISNAPKDDLKQLGNAVMQLVAHQKTAIQAGAFNAQEIAHQRIIEAETVEVKDV